MQPAPGSHMRRISLCLLVLIASTTVVAAREVKLCSEGSGSGGSDIVVARKPSTQKSPIVREAPGRDDKPQPTLHSDVGSGRPLRWHSFLPGMFR